MKVKFQFWKHSGMTNTILLFLIPSVVIELYHCPKVQAGFTLWIRLSWLFWTFRIKITNQD